MEFEENVIKWVRLIYTNNLDTNNARKNFRD